MYQPYPSSGQPTEPLRPAAPAPVLTAVKLMYAGAAVSAVSLIILLAFIGSLAFTGGLRVAIRRTHPSFTAAQVSHLYTFIITVGIVFGVAVIALWLWMARANGHGWNWARILSTVLFGLATLELISFLPQPVIHVGVGMTAFGAVSPMLTWLAGLAAVWLLWRPASNAFFKPQGAPAA